MSKQTGFTLIELVLVIVILGILAAVAVPTFVDLSTEADAAALDATAGAMASASVMNFAKERAAPGDPAVNTVDSCDDIANLIDGGLPAGYTLNALELVAAPDGTGADCTLTQTSTGNTKTFRALHVTPG